MTSRNPQDGPNLPSQLSSDVESLILKLELAADGRETYIVGNRLDFDQVASAFIQDLGDRVAGVACLSTHPVAELEAEGELFFNLKSQHLGKSKVEKPDLLLCQAYIASSNEVRAMVSSIFALMPVRNIFLAALTISEEAEFETKRYFADDGPVRVFANSMISAPPIEAWRAQKEFYRSMGEPVFGLPKYILDTIRGRPKATPRPRRTGTSYRI